MSVHTQTQTRRRFPLREFVRASSLHVGAAAAAAALRKDLVETGRLSGGAFDEAYAVARVTPGTNLLAMYTLLGERFAGWPGALIALSVGALVPAIVAVTLSVAYVTYSDHPLAHDAMKGARAGALAVLSWAVVRLLRPQISQASPGPLGLYVVVGYFVAGVPGAFAAALALATPAILAIPIARAVRHHRDARMRGASAAVVIASRVLMATTSVTLASTRPRPFHWPALAAVGFIALASRRVPPGRRRRVGLSRPFPCALTEAPTATAPCPVCPLS